MMYKCLHYKTCKSYVTFITDRGWIHIPSRQAYWMEHEKFSKRIFLLRNKLSPKEDRSNGCGWTGAAPANPLTIDTDICPQCDAVGELSDHHIASPRYPKRREKKSSTKSLVKRFKTALKTSSVRKSGCNNRCTHAISKVCNCACGGAFHGTALKLF